MSSVKKRVLKRYVREIVHMRQEKTHRRLGLILGAGVGDQFGFPGWDILIQKIAENPEVNGTHLIETSGEKTSKSRLLYEYFRSVCLGHQKADDCFNKTETEILARWHRIVRDELYEGVPENVEDLESKDEYLLKYLKLIREIPITINYNFDDTVERLIFNSLSDDEKKETIGYRVASGTSVHIVPGTPVIYHPNGYLPRGMRDNASTSLVFLEDAFADQLIDVQEGYYSFLANHLAQTTNLLLGVSLKDPNLRHMLRQSAIVSPGQCHYYVDFVEKGDHHNREYNRLFRRSNFETYNLVTLFLDSEQISALGQLLGMQRKEFNRLAEEVGVEREFKYFITGCVGVGKTSVVSSFRSLRTVDEWLEPLPPGMEKDPKFIMNPEELERIDKWVDSQVAKKNEVIREVGDGLVIIDRAPLDAFAFTEKDWKKRGESMKQMVRPGKSKWRLEKGQVFLLVGNPGVMAVRATIRQREVDSEGLSKQQDGLIRVYDSLEGITSIDTREKPLNCVVKEIARAIFLYPYKESDMDEWLENAIREAAV